MLDTPCSEVVRRVLATHSIRQFPLHFPSRASPCVITFQLDSMYNNRQPSKSRNKLDFSNAVCFSRVGSRCSPDALQQIYYLWCYLQATAYKTHSATITPPAPSEKNAPSKALKPSLRACCNRPICKVECKRAELAVLAKDVTQSFHF